MTASQPDLKTTAGKIADLSSRLDEALAPLGSETIEQAHSQEKMTARERILAVVDQDSFVEIDALAKHRVTEFETDRNRPATDGVVCGYATIDGRKVCIFAQDESIFDGQLGEVHGEKILKVIELATKSGVPLIGFYAGDGARLIEGIVPLAMQAKILRLITRASGVIPHIAVVSANASGAQGFLPALADILIMVGNQSALHVTAPDVVKAVTGVDTDAYGLGGADVHLNQSGTAHLFVERDADAAALIQDVLVRIPLNNRAHAPRFASGNNPEDSDQNIHLDSIVPDSSAAPYDMHEVITHIVDEGDFLELQPNYAANVITGFARIQGRSVAIIANQPMELAGCLNQAASAKAARFIRTADAFNTPIIQFVDVPGFQPGIEEEHGQVLKKGASLAYAFAEAEVGKIVVIIRRAIGAGYVLMGAKDLGADLVYAWPTAEIAAQDATGAVPVLYESKIKKAEAQGKDVAALTEQLISEYEDKYLTPYQAAERGLVDAVIPPSETRKHVIDGVELLERKVDYPPMKKHGNIPL